MMLPCNTVAFAAFELPNVRDTCPVVRRAGETANHNTREPTVAHLRCVFLDQAKAVATNTRNRRQPGTNELDSNVMKKIKAKKVLVLDSNIFISEVGLMSRVATALKYYLPHQKTKLVVPQVVNEECERKLKEHAEKKVEDVLTNLKRLSVFLGSVNGWTPPKDDVIKAQAKALARGEAFDAFVLNESSAILQRAQERVTAKLPPSYKKDSLPDCRLWEQCLELLRKHDVIFVSEDHDFRIDKRSMQLHPKLKAEAEGVQGGGRLTFHRDMNSLLKVLQRDEIPRLDSNKVFPFIYESVANKVSEILEKYGCQPEMSGTVEQKFFSTSQNDVVEVRLTVKDCWRNDENDDTFEFNLSGSCQYHIVDDELCNLSMSKIGVYKLLPNGNLEVVLDITYLKVSAYAGGARPIKPDSVSLDDPPVDSN